MTPIKADYVRFIRALSPVIIIAAICTACSTRGGKNINEGEIHYEIEYSGAIGSVPKEVLPGNLIVSFKDDKILFEMLSPIGNSGIINLANPDDEIYDTYFSLFTIRYYYAAKKGEMYPGFEAMQGMELRKTDKTSIICGYNCKNAEITFPADRSKIYEVWYTEEIDVKNPNEASPFYQIDGVMMSFFFLIGHSEMHFTAEGVYKKDIPDESFQRRPKYVKASREDLIRFINKMLML